MDAMNGMILRNRRLGPETVMQLAEERAPDGFSDIAAVLSAEELKEASISFKRAAGFRRRDGQYQAILSATSAIIGGATITEETCRGIFDNQRHGVIDQRPLTELQIRVVFLCALMIFLDGADTIMLGLVAPSIAATLGVSAKFLRAGFRHQPGGHSAWRAHLRPAWRSLWAQAPGDRGRRCCSRSFTLVTVWIKSFDQLLVLRFLTGLGLGGLAPNAVALTSEFAPKRLRSAFVALQWSAFPLGGVAIGLLGSVLIAPLGLAVAVSDRLDRAVASCCCADLCSS